ncbi:MAG: ribosome-binding factor A, partial [Elusimicrobiaceae bacterium]|nr:ribosome-binding factor A [Elusimicrobiaceae bacterium]
MIDRIKRLEELFLHEINTHVTRLIASGHFTGFITITAVKIAKDLATAKVYYSVFGSDADKKLAERNFEELRTKIGGLLLLSFFSVASVLALDNTETCRIVKFKFFANANYLSGADPYAVDD